MQMKMKAGDLHMWLLATIALTHVYVASLWLNREFDC